MPRRRAFAPAVLIAVAWSTAAILALSSAEGGSVEDRNPPRRKPLDGGQRSLLTVLLNAVDAAQAQPRDAQNGSAPDDLSWENDIFKASDHVAYVPFRMTLGAEQLKGMKATAMYIRAVSRHDGFRTSDEHSTIRDWLARGGDPPPPRREIVFVGPGELPVGGPALSSGRQSTIAPAEASAVLALQQRELQRQQAAEQAAKQKLEAKARDPYLFPFEEYYFFDLKSPALERALSVPPGEYDVFIALLDRGHAKIGEPTIIRRTITVPDFWNDRLGLSTLMLVSAVNTLKVPLPPDRQVEHPYTFGRAEVVPVRTTTFTPRDVLAVVFQIVNYGAPDADLSVDYTFYHVGDGERRPFNRTATQELTDADLPPVSPWETQAFVSQAVPLQSFPDGQYELEVSVRDRLTRATAKQSVRFSVQ